MSSTKAAAFDAASVPESNATSYPEPYATAARKRWNRKLGPVAGLKNFGVNITRIEPGGRSSQRHWHTAQDEFVYVLQGELTLHDNSGETVLRQGMCAGFPAGDPNGHCFLNHTEQDALILVVGDHTLPEEVHYNDIDLHLAVGADGKISAARKDRTPV